MSFLTAVGWLGIKWWIWAYFLFSILAGATIGLIYFKEQLKGKYYKIRFPEKVIKIFLHYNTNLYKIFWRLVPENNFFEMENGRYFFDSETVLKENDFFATQDKREKTIIKLEGKEYEFEKLMMIKQKGEKYPEVHYFYGNPRPLNFNLTDKDLTFSAKDMSEFEKNDLFVKLLTLSQERQTMFIVMIIAGLNLLATMFIIAKMMGWIK
ncbi:MAG: hypothetical protein PHQ60_16310 [Sideroxydans sp.]|nr:hypothetical protein [Sideroxydans sp.]